VAQGEFYKHYPGYRAPNKQDQKIDAVDGVVHDDVIRFLKDFKQKEGYPGERNVEDIQKGYKKMDFLNHSRPLCDEVIVETSDQLFERCKEDGINHLIYMGFAINWCILMSPGGMADMSKRGIV